MDFDNHWNTLIFFNKENTGSYLNVFHEKMSDFVSLLLFRFNLVIKLRKFGFESHWNTSIFFWLKNVALDSSMSHGKISDFVWLQLFGFFLVIKLRDFDFGSHWNPLIFFDKKNNSGVQTSCKIVSDLV